MVQAQVTAYEYCTHYSSGSVHFSQIRISAGRDFDPASPSFERRLIGPFNYSNNAQFIECSRSVTPNQEIALDYKISFEFNAIPVGSVTVDGMSHHIFPIPGHPDVGFILGYKTYPEPDNEVNDYNINYSNQSPTTWKAIDYTGMPSTPNIKMTITSDSHSISA